MTNLQWTTGLNVLANPLTRIANPFWIDFVLQHFNPLLSVNAVHARVERIVPETADTKTFVLQPNKQWQGFQPGQHVRIKVRIGGVLHERCYSLTSDPASKQLSITVKRQPGGLVSNWLNDHCRLNDVIEISAAEGDFHLPAQLPAKLLFIAGGSGITPVYNMLCSALERNPQADVRMLYFVRSERDIIFEKHLLQLAAQHPGLQLQICPAQSASAQYPVIPAFSAEMLADQVPDYQQREAFLCGPGGLMDLVKAVFDSAKLSEHLHCENFVATAPTGSLDRAQSLTFRRANLTVTSDAPTLLEAAEAAGLRPASGCRMGICHSCTCRKESGVVRDRITGAIDDKPGSRIRICVSEPLSAVTLDL